MMRFTDGLLDRYEKLPPRRKTLAWPLLYVTALAEAAVTIAIVIAPAAALTYGLELPGAILLGLPIGFGFLWLLNEWR